MRDLRLPPLPQLTFHAHSQHQGDRWNALSDLLEPLRLRASSLHLDEHLLQEAHAALEGDDHELFRLVSRRPRPMTRAILTLWAEDEELTLATLTPRRLDKLCWEPGLTRLQARQLINICLHHYAVLRRRNSSLLKILLKAARRELKRLNGERPLRGLAEAIFRQHELILHVDGPKQLSRLVAKEAGSVTQFLERRGLQEIHGTSYATALSQEHYLRRLRAASPSRTHSFLEHLRAEPSLESMTEDGRLFGHHVIETMTSQKGQPVDQWVGTILHIAGDPRIRRGETWNKWWQLIEEGSRQRVISWLSRKDLELFLDSYKSFADSSAPDAARQFEDREVFIKGLMELGLIRQTRLFLGAIAMTEISQHTDSAFAKAITQIEGHRHESGPKAIIAMDCGDFQLMEGSHNHQLWVFVSQRPHDLFERTGSTIPYSVLRQIAKRTEQKDTKGRLVYRGFPHLGSTWQMNAVEYLHEHGHRVPLSKLMTEQRYSELSRRHSVPFHLA